MRESGGKRPRLRVIDKTWSKQNHINPLRCSWFKACPAVLQWLNRFALFQMFKPFKSFKLNHDGCIFFFCQSNIG